MTSEVFKVSLSNAIVVCFDLQVGFGELWSMYTLTAYLKAQGCNAVGMNARDVLVVTSHSTGLGEKGTVYV